MKSGHYLGPEEPIDVQDGILPDKYVTIGKKLAIKRSPSRLDGVEACHWEVEIPLDSNNIQAGTTLASFSTLSAEKK